MLLFSSASYALDQKDVYFPTWQTVFSLNDFARDVQSPYKLTNVNFGIRRINLSHQIYKNVGFGLRTDLEFSGYGINGIPIFYLPNSDRRFGIMLWGGDGGNGWKSYLYRVNGEPQIGRYTGNNTFSTSVQLRAELVALPTNNVEQHERIYKNEEIIFPKQTVKVGEVITYIKEGGQDVPEGIASYYLTPRTLRQNIHSCEYTTGNIEVPLATVSSSSLRNIGNELSVGNFSISVNNCGLYNRWGTQQGNIINDVKISFLDANDVTNTTNELSILNEEGSASGIKIKIYPYNNNASPIYFGNLSTINNNNSISMNYNQASGRATQRFEVRYIKKEQQIRTGNVRAMAYFSFSYQ